KGSVFQSGSLTDYLRSISLSFLPTCHYTSTPLAIRQNDKKNSKPPSTASFSGRVQRSTQSPCYLHPPLVSGKSGYRAKKLIPDRTRGRTWNLPLSNGSKSSTRRRTPCHWAIRPVVVVGLKFCSI